MGASVPLRLREHVRGMSGELVRCVAPDISRYAGGGYRRKWGSEGAK